MAQAETPSERPKLLLVRGDATPEEVAAIVAVLAGRAAASGPAPAAPQRSAWADPSLALRRDLGGGPNAWVQSGQVPGARTRASW